MFHFPSRRSQERSKTSRTRKLKLESLERRELMDGNGFIAAGSSLSLQNAPSNNDFVNRVAIIGTSATLSGNNLNATKETNEPLHAGNSGGKSVWWTWTAPASGNVQIDTIGSPFDTLLAIYAGQGLSSLTPIVSDDDGGIARSSKVVLGAVAGTTYQIAVDGWNGASGEIKLNLSLMPTNPVPANNNFADRSRLTGSLISLNATNGGATKEVNEPNHANNAGGKSIWWTWTAPTTGRFQIDTIASSFDTTLGVYTGSSVTGLTLIVSDDDAGGSGTSQVLLNAIAGTTYQIAVDGWNGASGNIKLNLKSLQGSPLNDSFASRVSITGNAASVSASNVGATKEASEPNHAGNSGGKSVWWNWTAPATGRVQIDTIASTFDTTLAVYRGSSVSALTLVTEDDDNGGGRSSKVTFDAVEGTMYQIAVDGYGGSAGDIRLNLQLTPSGLTRGSVLVGSISRAGQEVLNTFDAEANELLQLSHLAERIDHRLVQEIRNPAGMIVFTDGNWRFRTETAGRYTVKLRSENGTATGNFRISLESISTPSMDAITIERGSLAKRNLTQPLQYDQTKFLATNGERLQVRVRADNADHRLRVSLIGPGGGLVFTNGEGLYIVPTTGTYFVQVSSENMRATGSYRIGLETISSASPDAITIARGSVITGTLVESLQVNQIKFMAEANEVLRLRVASVDPSLRIEPILYGPGGGRIFLNHFDSFTVPSRGTYVLNVLSNGPVDIGSYRVGLESLSSPSPDSTTIERGSIVTGAITESFQVNQIRFTAALHEVLQIRTATNNPNERIEAMVFNSQGGQVFLDHNSRFTVGADGTYVLNIWSSNPFALSTYRVGLESITSPSLDAIPIQRGQTKNDRISQALEVDQFSFSAEMSQQFVILAYARNASHALQYEIYDLFGRRVFLDHNNRLTAATRGMYIIQIWSTDFQQLGDYSVSLS